MTELRDASKSCEARLLSKILCGEGMSFRICDWVPDSKIHSQDEIPDGAYLIQSGAIGLKAKEEQHLYFDVLGPDDILGLSETLGGHPFLCDAVVLQPTKAVFISRSELNRLLCSDPIAAAQILKAVANQTNSLLKLAAELKAGRRGSRAGENQLRSGRGPDPCDKSHKRP